MYLKFGLVSLRLQTPGLGSYETQNGIENTIAGVNVEEESKDITMAEAKNNNNTSVWNNTNKANCSNNVCNL